MINAGMRILLNRSTPFSTPNATTMTRIATKIRKKMIGCHVDVMKFTKYCCDAFTAAPFTSTVAIRSNLPIGVVKKANTYFATQPPMTQ